MATRPSDTAEAATAHVTEPAGARLGVWFLTTLLIAGFGYAAYYRYQAQLADDALGAMRGGQYSRAGSFLQDAADEGSVDAQLLLGNLYYVGLGYKQDPQRAAELYREAGLNGNIDAQYNLALIYHNGYGTARDNVQAAAWFLLADAGGNPRADTYLRTLTGQMNPNMIQQAYELQRNIGGSIEALKKP